MLGMNMIGIMEELALASMDYCDMGRHRIPVRAN